ncbi:MAG: hypothetical protein QG643_1098 [Pseudomonadota bacterium]|nr:hypothetical protein [Pseudomonadota bacterium]
MRRQLAARQHARTHGGVGLAQRRIRHTHLAQVVQNAPGRMGTSRALGMHALLRVGFPPGNNERLRSGQQNGARHGFSFKVVPLGRTARVIPYNPSRALPA